MWKNNYLSCGDFEISTKILEFQAKLLMRAVSFNDDVAVRHFEPDSSDSGVYTNFVQPIHKE